MNQGHVISTPSVAKISDFLLFLLTRSPLSVSSIKGYRFMLSSVFKFCLLELSSSFILHDLVRSFELERPRRPVGPPAWDLSKVLVFLQSSSFEPLRSRPLCAVTMKVLFLLSLATAKRVSELQSISAHVAFRGDDLSLCYLPEFVAKTESEHNPIPRSFLVRSLAQFVGDLPEDYLLCPVRAVRIYLFDIFHFSSSSFFVCVS